MAARGPRETWSTLAAIAALTSRVEFGPLVAVTNFLNPALLAKKAAGLATCGADAGRWFPGHDHVIALGQRAGRIARPNGRD